MLVFSLLVGSFLRGDAGFVGVIVNFFSFLVCLRIRFVFCSWMMDFWCCIK